LLPESVPSVDNCPRTASPPLREWLVSIGMDEGSTRSREETVARGMPRDVVEA
jgi:hypothetical protein